VYSTERNKWQGNGYFEGADALTFELRGYDGSWEYSRQCDFKFYLILSVTRTEHFERPDKNADTTLDDQRAAEVGRLNKRLDRLGSDSTDTTERFKIERQIYDLQREADRDEWPEVINA